MILDDFQCLSRYGLPHADALAAFMSSRDSMQVPEGEYELLGRDLFVRVMAYEPTPAAERRFETHRVYADVQLVIAGRELMQVAPVHQLSPLTDYDAAGDVRFFSAAGCISSFVVGAGQFAVFYPGEAHRPSCLYEAGSGPVRKFVFKIKMD